VPLTVREKFFIARLSGGTHTRAHCVLQYISAVLRIGSGVDVHAFAQGIPLWLGGIHIPHTHGLAGHSDGDAAIHALIDALLGAAGRGDIGEWFPSTEERWRNVRSTDMLRHVWTALYRDGWRLENADLTLVAAHPRLAPYRYQMRQSLAETLSVSLTQISLKATTTDGLGAIGRAEGLLAMASALLWRADD
jgi:2-C-methyl-D-erythritol 2,4-cyclodiphosphate synthase